MVTLSMCAFDSSIPVKDDREQTEARFNDSLASVLGWASGLVSLLAFSSSVVAALVYTLGSLSLETRLVRVWWERLLSGKQLPV